MQCVVIKETDKNISHEKVQDDREHYHCLIRKTRNAS